MIPHAIAEAEVYRPEGCRWVGLTLAPTTGDNMGIRSTRGFLYWLARLLGDVEAVRKGGSADEWGGG